MCESGLINLEKVGIRPTSQKKCFTLWLGWFLKRILKSKCFLALYFEEDEIRKWDKEQKVWEGNKTRDLMNKWEEFKDEKTPFETWVFMKGIGEGLHTKSLTMSSLEVELLFNSTTFDFLSNSLSFFNLSLAWNSFLSFSSLAFLIFSSLAFSSFFSFLFLFYLFFLFFSFSTKLLKLFFFSLLFILSKLFKFCLLFLMFCSLSLFTQEQVQIVLKIFF